MDWFYLDVVRIRYETDEAFLCVVDGLEEAVWIPKSQCADPQDYAASDESFTLAITPWLARQRGLE